MFVLHDMLIEVAVAAVVLTVVLLSASILAASCREWLERRRAHESRARLRRSVWRDYAAACAPAAAQSAAPVVAAPQAEVATRTARDRRTGLTAGPAKA